MQQVVSEDEKQERAREAASKAYRQLLKDLAAEQRSTGNSTEFGKQLRYSNGNKNISGLLSGSFNNALIETAFLNEALKGTQEIIKALSLLAQWPSVQAAQMHYIPVVDTMDDMLGVHFAQVAVSEDIAKQLAQEEMLVQMQDRILAQLFEKSGFMGPFIEEKTRYDLMQEFRLRQEPEADFTKEKTYAHCITRVAELQQALACDAQGGPCMVRVFGVVSTGPQGGRGYVTKAAEYGQEVTNSNLANVLSQYEGPRVPAP